jgi:hypothetical protein
VHIDWDVPEEYQFALDNIQLGSGDKFSFSYKAIYQQTDAIISIDINDEEITEHSQ